MAKMHFQQNWLNSSVSHHSSEIILYADLLFKKIVLSMLKTVVMPDIFVETIYF